MNRGLAREIAGCLRVSGSPEKPVSRLPTFSRHDWERALDWLDHTGLALWFWDRLKGLGARDAVPPEIGAQLERNFVDHSFRVASMAEEFDSINRSFASAGVEFVVLKGFALTPEYAPDARLRIAYDYDYLLRAESMERIAQALRNRGYIRRQERVDHPVVYVHSTHTLRMASRRDDLYSATLHRAVELHTRLWEPETLRIPLWLPDDFLARKRLRNWQGLRFYSLSEEDELVFQALHAFRHILECWCRLYSFLEIAYFLEHRRADSVFWRQFGERIRMSPLLSEMVGVVFSLAAGLFGAAIPDAIDAEVIRTMRDSLGLWVNRYGYDSALANFAGNKYNLLLYREFVPDDATWREIRRRRLFPLHRPTRAGQASTPGVSSRLAAGWKQGSYVARRLLHHLIAAVQYAFESIEWERIRTAGR
jgi:hypothetical protein